MEPEADQRELVVPLRPNATVVGTVSLLAFMGAMFVLPFILVFPVPSVPLSPLETWLALSAVVVGVTPALLCIFYRCHARLVLSETGLRWRTWGEWRRVSWDGVQDYYDVPPHSSRDFDKLMTIQTDAGNVRLCRDWRGTDRVRQVVQERATAAETAEWGVLGQRSCAADTRTFGYSQKAFWNLVGQGFGLVVPYAVFGWYWILRPYPHGGSTWTTIAEGWTPGDGGEKLFDTVCFALGTVPLYVCCYRYSAYLSRQCFGAGGCAKTPGRADYDAAFGHHV